ncbi:MAG: polysaccharide biosynthesis tyrosine autokinase [Chloroflexi bacterium]|nr:MAG: polysaccharide biosynthesis tyrosine autokinase [Chloroflexota bacterium]
MEIEIREYLAPLRRWWWLILLTTLVAGVSSYLATRQQIPVYRSTTRLMIGSTIESPNPSSQEFSTTRQLAATYVDIANSATVRNDAMEALGLPFLPRDIVVRQLNDTNIIDITVTDSDPRIAQAVANELARQLILRSPASQEDDQFVNELLADYEEAIDETQAEIAAKQEELGNLQSAREIAQVQSEIASLESTLQNLTTSYADLRSSTQRGATNTISVIEPASLPRNPVTPNNTVTILTAAGIGLVLAASAAFVLEYIDDTVRSPNQLARLSGLPTLTGIAEIKMENDESKLVTAAFPRSPIAESFRVLRTAIQYAVMETPTRVLLVTSSVPEEGKSTTASNLAVVMAQAGLNVLLIDADLRRPSQHRIFDLPNKRGLTTLLTQFNLADTSDNVHRLIQQTVQVTHVEGLQVLTAGPIPPNPSELLGSRKMQALLTVMATQFDMLILDSPPVLAVTDAAVLSVQAEGVLLVARAAQTRKDNLIQAIERLNEVHANILGCVLNDLKPRSEGYNAYYYYRDPYYIMGDAEESKPQPQKEGGLRQRLLRREQATMGD